MKLIQKINMDAINDLTEIENIKQKLAEFMCSRKFYEFEDKDRFIFMQQFNLLDMYTYIVEQRLVIKDVK